MKDHEKRELVNALTNVARKFANTEQLRSRIAGEVLPALGAITAAQEELRACQQDAIALQAEVARLTSELGKKQAEIDRLMLEYCPADMTAVQLAEWGKHQVVVDIPGAIRWEKA